MNGSSTGPEGALRGDALIVEDNLIIAMEAEEILLGLGSPRCHVASSVRASLEILDRAPITFALLDIDLGEETCEAVALRLLALGTPFIFASGYDEFPGFSDVFGAVPVVLKPYTEQDIAAAIAGLANA